MPIIWHRTDRLDVDPTHFMAKLAAPSGERSAGETPGEAYSLESVQPRSSRAGISQREARTMKLVHGVTSRPASLLREICSSFFRS
jgi:hypothetical protein